jgi:hypothetical protein
LGANESPIVSPLIAIPQILSQLGVPLENNLGHFLGHILASNYMNKILSLFNTLKTKPFANWFFLQMWSQTPHMTTS